MSERVRLRQSRTVAPDRGASHRSDIGPQPAERASAAVVKAGTVSGGRPLNAQTRGSMEAGFGHDFSQVRVHTDAPAQESASFLEARAYALGNDLVFAEGQYDPEGEQGRRLLAHELTHVVQQAGNPGGMDGAGELAVSQPADPQEREAEEVAASVMTGSDGVVDAAPAPTISHAGRGELQRWPWDDDNPSGGGGGGVLDSLGSMASGAASAVGGAASTVYQSYEKGTDLKPLQAGLGRGVDWVEKQAAEGNQKMADSAKGIPVLEQLAQGAAFVGTQSTNLAGGLVKGAGDVVGGMANAFLHPIDAAAGMEGILEHNATVPFLGSTLKGAHGLYDLAAHGGGQYGNSMGELANHVLNPLQSTEDDAKFNTGMAKGILAPGEKGWQQWADNPGDALGRAAANVAPMVMGMGEGSAAEEGAQAAKAAEAAGEASGAAGPKTLPGLGPPGPPVKTLPGLGEPVPGLPESVPVTKPGVAPPQVEPPTLRDPVTQPGVAPPQVEPPTLRSPGVEPAPITERAPSTPMAPTEPAVPGKSPMADSVPSPEPVPATERAPATPMAPTEPAGPGNSPMAQSVPAPEPAPATERSPDTPMAPTEPAPVQTRNPVQQMTPVNPADAFPGAPQPPGFRSGPVGSFEAPPRNPVQQMTPVNPADVFPGAPQPPGFRSGPVGSFEAPPPSSGSPIPAAGAPEPPSPISQLAPELRDLPPGAADPAAELSDPRGKLGPKTGSGDNGPVPVIDNRPPEPFDSKAFDNFILEQPPVSEPAPSIDSLLNGLDGRGTPEAGRQAPGGEPTIDELLDGLGKRGPGEFPKRRR